MSPESLEKNVYNSKTDVWSYGVTLWELMTRGVQPYPNVQNWEVLQYIKYGNRLPQIEHCPPDMYEIMLSCWDSQPASRPTFGELIKEIHAMVRRLESENNDLYACPRDLEVNYINMNPPIGYYNQDFNDRSPGCSTNV